MFPSDRKFHQPAQQLPYNEFHEYQTGEPIIRTSDIYIEAVKNLPSRFEYPHLLSGYGVEKRSHENPLYRTTNSDYGWYRPNQHTVPCKFYPKEQKFSNNYGKFGMYRNMTLNMK